MRPELAQAIELLRGDSPEELEQAIGLLQKTVYSFSMKVCGHPEDAEDTMQEVLYRSLRHLAKLEDPRALAVWLYTVTRNRCWRMRRKGSTAPKVMLSLDELMPDEAEMAQLLADASREPEKHLLRGEQNNQLHQAILRIPAQLRIVLVLHDMEELSTGEVAQILGLQQGTVRVRLHRARLSVRKELSRIAAVAAKSKSPKPSRTARGRNRPVPRHQPAECHDLFANLSDYLDGEVEPVKCEHMREHIEACPSCVAFLRDLRAAIDRCRAMEVPCDRAVMPRLRAILTREYLRMLGVPAPKKTGAAV
ncbi:MAG TPA: sigma-70 family RNA polymerase sigma factor [Terracidiphilus sp.]|nr:sigma-70 family RNA polymerase sigma factor [Terracidiphilus sp.]